MLRTGLCQFLHVGLFDGCNVRIRRTEWSCFVRDHMRAMQNSTELRKTYQTWHERTLMSLSTELHLPGVLWTGCRAALAPAVLRATASHCKSRMSLLKIRDLVCFPHAAHAGVGRMRAE